MLAIVYWFYWRRFLLVAEVCGMYMIPGQVTVNRGCRQKLYIRTQVITSCLTEVTATAGYPRLNSYTVTCEKNNEKVIQTITIKQK